MCMRIVCSMDLDSKTKLPLQHFCMHNFLCINDTDVKVFKVIDCYNSKQAIINIIKLSVIEKDEFYDYSIEFFQNIQKKMI